MNKLPIDPISSSPIKALQELKHEKKKHPMRVGLPHISSESKNKAIKAVTGSHHPKINAALTGLKNEPLIKPIDIWNIYPQINLIEIRSITDITDLKKTLKINISESSRAPMQEFDLTPFGFERTIQVLSKTYVPIRRSEHQEIQAILAERSPELGMTYPLGLTFIIVEDKLFDKVVRELHVHSEMALPERHDIEKKEPKESRAQPQQSITIQHSHKEIVKALIAIQKNTTKIIRQLFSDEAHRKEKVKQNHEEELLKEEKYIKFSIKQFERLQKLVLKESEKRNLSLKDIETIASKWEDSCPPFPIRTIHGSDQWRKLKSEMIKSILKHFK